MGDIIGLIIGIAVVAIFVWWAMGSDEKEK
jgi:hypothetical protein